MRKKRIIVDVFADHVKSFPNKLAFVCASTGNKLTFQEAGDLVNKIANVFYEAGYRKGDVVCSVNGESHRIPSHMVRSLTSWCCYCLNEFQFTW